MKTNEELIQDLMSLGLVTEDKRPVSYSGFKNRASIHRYGSPVKYKIVFVGLPKKNLFGFYVMFGDDTKVMKQAYAMFISLVKGNMEDYNIGDLQWGNAGIPLKYKNLRTL